MGFVYVNTEEARDALLAQGAALVSAKSGTSLWAFKLPERYEIDFDLVGDYVLSNVLMF